MDPRFLPWPASFLVPLGAYALAVRRVPKIRACAPRVRRGEVGARAWLLALGVILVSSGALFLWMSLLHPDLRDLQRMLPQQPVALLLLGGVGFALLNALVEEAAFRVVFFEALSAVGTITSAVIVQALAFGALHLHGFPRGIVGVVLATIYGLMLGALRVRLGGMLVVYVTHVFADITIFALLLWSVRFS